MFNTLEVVAVSCAIHRVQGFVKKNSLVPEGKTPNATMLYNHFYNDNVIPVQPADTVLAEEIIDYLKGLAFKAFERELTGFESNVLKFVQSSEVDNSVLGIAASLPEVYENKQAQDAWSIRESALATDSEFVGELKKRGHFELTIENIRYIRSTSSNLYCCSDKNGNIVKFFKDEDLGKVGTVICITAYVKGHSVSVYHGGKETMVNRIKIEQIQSEDQ